MVRRKRPSKFKAMVAIEAIKGKKTISYIELIRLFEEQGVKISVGNMGFKDNMYIERFWRTYKI